MPGCSLAKRHGFEALRRLVKAAFGLQRCQGAAIEGTARKLAASLLALCSPAEVDLLAEGAPLAWCTPERIQELVVEVVLVQKRCACAR